MGFEINYVKRQNDKLFKDLESNLNVTNCQNYIPIYNNFFKLNDTNYNHINLNNNLYIKRLKNKVDNLTNTYSCELKDISSNNSIIKNVFFKFSPLLDPSKYMTGKYNTENQNLLNVPNFNGDNCHEKTNESNNSAYVDAFFSYLTSKLLHTHGFIHGIDFYGAYVGIKNDFLYDVIDEIDFLVESNFFNKNRNILFSIDETLESKIFEVDTRNCKKRLLINNNNENNEYITLDDIKSLDELDKLFIQDSSTNTDADITEINNDYNETIETGKINKNSSNHSSSFCSSRSSNTNYDDDLEQEKKNNDTDDVSLEIEELDLNDSKDNNSDNNNDNDNDKEWEDVSASDDKSMSESSEEIDVLNATIKKFPVNIISLEKCEDTLDNLINNDELNLSEFTSALMQTIMILITYQRVFKFTHNDLHTNNIMYVNTNEKFIFYKYDNKYYKVPTYGKIYKIIDFGRAIYKFNEKLLCSDSFNKEGDAATQYNFEPFIDDKKPRLEPNYSFDLCRLACSIYDFFEDSEEELEPIKTLITDWCKDDKGRNVLYKNNGEERYPDFKLYKMIARTVHNHVPSAQLEREIFSQYEIAKSKIGKIKLCVDIDGLPKYY